MIVLTILEWLMNGTSVITSCILLMFASSLLYILLRGKSK